MASNLNDAFRVHEVALGLRAYRQQLLASNIANADTPRYQARDFDFTAAFDAALSRREAAGPGSLARSSPRHLAPAGEGLAGAPLKFREPAQAGLDGNTVEMDVERAQFADNALHYEASLTLLGMEIRKMLSAIQG